MGPLTRLGPKRAELLNAGNRRWSSGLGAGSGSHAVQGPKSQGVGGLSRRAAPGAARTDDTVVGHRPCQETRLSAPTPGPRNVHASGSSRGHLLMPGRPEDRSRAVTPVAPASVRTRSRAPGPAPRPGPLRAPAGPEERAGLPPGAWPRPAGPARTPSRPCARPAPPRGCRRSGRGRGRRSGRSGPAALTGRAGRPGRKLPGASCGGRGRRGPRGGAGPGCGSARSRRGRLGGAAGVGTALGLRVESPRPELEPRPFP